MTLHLRGRLLQWVFQLLYTRLGFAHEATGRLVFGGAWDARRCFVVPDQIEGLILDVGCGEGKLLTRLDRRGIGTIGVEPSATMAHRARHAGLTVIRASAQAIPIESGTIQHIVCTYPGPWIMDRETWEELGRITRPGATVSILLGGDLSRSGRFWFRRLILWAAYGRQQAAKTTLPPLGTGRLKGDYLKIDDRWGTSVIWEGWRRRDD